MLLSGTGAEVFRSGDKIIKSGRESFMHISIPEFQGIKALNGTISNYEKNIAILPREELLSSDDLDGRFYYSATFENWIDLNNAETMILNQLTLEVKNPLGILVQDMNNPTMCVIKIRDKPMA